MPRPDGNSAYANYAGRMPRAYNRGRTMPGRANGPGHVMFRRDLLMDVRLPHSERPPAAVYDKSSARPHVHGRWRIAAIMAAAVVVALALWRLFFLGGSQRSAPPPPPVRVAAAQIRDVTVQEHTIGTIVANNTVQVTSRVEGQLVAAHFKEGDIV